MNFNKIKNEINELKKNIPSMDDYEKLYNEFIDDYNRTYVTKETPNSITKVMYHKINPALSDDDKQIIWDTITSNQVNDIETLRQMKPMKKLILRLMEYPMPVLSKDDDIEEISDNRFPYNY